MDNHLLRDGLLRLFMCWSVAAGNSGCSGDKTTTPVKKLKILPFWGGMHIAATSPLCSVIKKRSLGKRIL